MERVLSKRRVHQVHNARVMAQWKGFRPAAAYLRKCGWSLEAALYILLGI